MYSPAPWKNTNGTIESFDGWHVASIHGHVGVDAKKSNGDIVAAAPNLLAALMLAVEQYDGYPNDVLSEIAPDWLCEARSAIALALKGNTIS